MLSVRADLIGIDPYVSPQLPARRRMNTNESPYAPPESVSAALAEELAGLSLNRYPDRDAADLVGALAARWGRPPGGIWVANGSNEVFMHLFLAFGGPGRTALTFEPTYSLHSLIPRLALTDVDHVARNGDFDLELETAVDHIVVHRPEVVVVCSPNNPTGGIVPLEAIDTLCRRTAGLVVVDEAYGEFAGDGASALPLLEEHDNLAIVRTFSKAWRLAGVRLGYMLAAPEIVERMSVVRLPYHLSAPSQAVGVAALNAEAEMQGAVERIVSERERVSTALAALGMSVVSSRANFVLFAPSDADGVWQSLYDAGVLVRSYPGSEALAGYLRVTIGTPEDNDDFLEVLAGVVR